MLYSLACCKDFWLVSVLHPSALRTPAPWLSTVASVRDTRTRPEFLERDNGFIAAGSCLRTIITLHFRRVVPSWSSCSFRGPYLWEGRAANVPHDLACTTLLWLAACSRIDHHRWRLCYTHFVILLIEPFIYVYDLITTSCLNLVSLYPVSSLSFLQQVSSPAACLLLLQCITYCVIAALYKVRIGHVRRFLGAYCYLKWLWSCYAVYHECSTFCSQVCQQRFISTSLWNLMSCPFPSSNSALFVRPLVGTIFVGISSSIE